MTDNFKNDFLKGSAEFTKNTPFSIWPETNLMLDDFYKRPDVNIKDDNRGLNIKNSLRHIVGSAREYQHYPYLAVPLGFIKEGWDLISEPFIYMGLNKSLNYPKYLGKTFKDTLVDTENNRIGRNFIKQNPNATDEDIMQYALKQATENHDRQYNSDSSKKFIQMLLKQEKEI